MRAPTPSPRLATRTLCALAASACAALAVACDPPPPAPLPPVVLPDAPPDPDVVVDCDEHDDPATSAVDLPQMAARFAAELHPIMRREEGGCIACHASDSDRLMRMADATDTIASGDVSATAGEDTFFRVRAGGFLRLTNGTMPTRIVDQSMPEGGPPWSDDEKALVLDFACDLATIDDAGVPPDEEFPPDLLSPYDGPPITDYDNTFLSYDQLRGRVAVQFDDDWVRLGVDQFSENISLFGGVDFVRSFVPARQATPEFFTGLDLLAEDVCARAANDRTGPFAGLDLAAPIADEAPSELQAFEAEVQTFVGLAEGCRPGPGATSVVLCNASTVTTTVALPSDGDYRIIARARGDEAISITDTDLPKMEVRLDSDVVQVFDVPEAPGFQDYEAAPFHVDAAGQHILSVSFINDCCGDGNDRNLFVDRYSIEGPLPGTSTGSPTGVTDARARLTTLFSRVLLRAPRVGAADDEVTPLYDLLLELERFDGDRAGAFAGACQALVNHPDFLFTRAPTFDELDPTDAAGAQERERMLLVQTALDLVDRPPLPEELSSFDLGATREELIDEWLASEEAKAGYYQRVREILEYDGTPDGDEPARLWTYIMLEDRPLKDVLTANYTVDESFERVERDALHGETGLLTMRGFIKGKPGLPHYNYAARVFTGFLGVVFDVPQEALDARATATAASTVDPTSICFTCHRLLTPLAHQRLKWDDDGNRREQFDDGRAIDDSDQSLVADYPFKGRGLESFSLVAVRKEAFLRRMANVHFQLAFGRNLRHDTDERDVYLKLFQTAAGGQGTFKDVIRTVLTSRSYTNPPAPIGDDGGAP